MNRSPWAKLTTSCALKTRVRPKATRPYSEPLVRPAATSWSRSDMRAAGCPAGARAPRVHPPDLFQLLDQPFPAQVAADALEPLRQNHRARRAVERRALHLVLGEVL